MSRPERVKVRAFRADLADIINRVRFQKSRVVLTKHGEDIAVVLSLDEFARLRGAYTTLGDSVPRA